MSQAGNIKRNQIIMMRYGTMREDRRGDVIIYTKLFKCVK